MVDTQGRVNSETPTHLVAENIIILKIRESNCPSIGFEGKRLFSDCRSILDALASKAWFIFMLHWIFFL